MDTLLKYQHFSMIVCVIIEVDTNESIQSHF